jgi:hypothetical protein
MKLYPRETSPITEIRPTPCPSDRKPKPSIMLIRLQPADLPVDAPLPWPVLSKQGAMLLPKGAIVPASDAPSLLQAGIFRRPQEKADKAAYATNGGAGDKPDLLGLLLPVDSMQMGLFEEGAKERTLIQAEFLGLIPKVSLMIAHPQRSGRLLTLTSGQQVVVNMLVNKHVHGFNSHILCTYNFPFPHVHLNYPDSVKTNVLRASNRIAVTLLALSKSLGGDVVPVTIVDISSSGLGINTDEPLGEIGAPIALSFSLKVGGVPHPMRLAGLIRSIRPVKSQKTRRYGVELVNLKEEQSLLIQAFIYECF